MPVSLASTPPGATPSRLLPPLPARGQRTDAMAPAQRNAMVAGIVALHVAAAWGLLQIREVREAVAEAAPMFVNLIAPPEPPKPEVIIPPPPVPVPVPQVQKRPPPQVIAAAPSPAPSTFVVPEQKPVVVEPPPPVAMPVVVAAAAPAPPPPVQAKIIPASAVQYLEPISLEYPRLSKRMGETGRVLVRVYIDEAGLAKNVQVNRSSGHPRLDEAALAAIQKARFKPYTENGQAVAGWAFIPLEFELEK